MKTKEELGKIKEEYTELNKKLSELTEEELKQISGGFGIRHPSFSSENSEGIDWEYLIEG